jgi:hypothetical protein
MPLKRQEIMTREQVKSVTSGKCCTEGGELSAYFEVVQPRAERPTGPRSI